MVCVWLLHPVIRYVRPCLLQSMMYQNATPHVNSRRCITQAIVVVALDVDKVLIMIRTLDTLDMKLCRHLHSYIVKTLTVDDLKYTR